MLILNPCLRDNGRWQPRKHEGKSTKELSRGHKIIVSDNNLITITGGKWTSYRLMAEDTVDKAIAMKLVDARPCVTKNSIYTGTGRTRT